MRKQYDIMREAWVPVIYKDGSYKTLSPLEIFEEAHLIKDFSSPIPLHKFALTRFFVIILCDAYRFEKDDEIIEYVKRKSFQVADIEKYINDCNFRASNFFGQATNVFDLFDKNKPFLQMNDKELKLNLKKNKKGEFDKISANKIFYEYPSGNNNTFRCIHPKDAFRLDELTLAMITQPFFTPMMDGSKAHQSAHGKYTYVLIDGENLFEKILRNTVSAESIKQYLNTENCFSTYDYSLPWNTFDVKEFSDRDVIRDLTFMQGLLHLTRGYKIILDEDNKVRNLYGMVYYPKYECLTWRDINQYYFKTKKGLQRYSFMREYDEFVDIVNIVDDTEGAFNSIKNKKDERECYRPFVLDKFLELETSYLSDKEYDEKFQNWGEEKINLIFIGCDYDKGDLVSAFETKFSFPMKLFNSTELHTEIMCLINDYVSVARFIKESFPKNASIKEKSCLLFASKCFKYRVVTEFFSKYNNLLFDICKKNADKIKLKNNFHNTISEFALSETLKVLENSDFTAKEKVLICDNLKKKIMNKINTEKTERRELPVKEYNSFFAKIHRLSHTEQILLSKACGRHYDNIDMRTLVAFSKLVDEYMEDQIKIWFCISTIYCSQLEHSPNCNLPTGIKKMLKNEENGFLENRYIDLLDCDNANDNYFIKKLTDIVKILNKNGYYVSTKHLLHSLLVWDTDKSIRTNWAMECFSNIKIKKESK